MIDLHIHTTASDGTFSPKEIVQKAAALNLTAIAITDHDTVAGVAEALAASKKFNLPVVPGVELSVEEDFEMHILGLFIDHTNPGLVSKLLEIKNGRRKRNREMVKNLNALGFNLNFDKIAAEAGTEDFGRPYIAQALLKNGHVRSIKEAFDKYLSFEGSVFVTRSKLSVSETISLIKNAGGLAILAHPVDIKLSKKEFGDFLNRLIDNGLDGIEVHYSKNSKEQTSYYNSLAEKLNILKSGGSDFHGDNKPNLKLGTGYGSLKVPDKIYFDLLKHKNSIVL